MHRSIRKAPTRLATVMTWLFGVLLFAGVIAVMVHFSELRELERLLRSLEARWLLVAVATQTATYFCAAGVWQAALRREHQHVGFLSLVRLALVLLFTNQALPSAGLSGGAVVVEALRRRHVPAKYAMGALLIGLLTTYIAYLVALPLSLVLLRVYHELRMTVVVAMAGFSVIAVGVPAMVLWYRHAMPRRLRKRLTHVPGIGPLLDAVGRAPARLLRDRGVIHRAVLLQFAELVLDAATLGIMLAALNVRPAPTAVFGSYVTASAVSQLIPVPLGLGGFEAVLVVMLRSVGMSLEVAITATLLFRGFTFWLPMLPGLLFARKELGSARA